VFIPSPEGWTAPTACDGVMIPRRTSSLPTPRLSSMVATTALGAAGASSDGRSQAGPTGGTADCQFGDHCYNARAARGRLRRPAAAPARDRRPWRDRGAAELAESQLSRRKSLTCGWTLLHSTACFHLPAPSLKVVSTFPSPSHPWFAFGEEVLDAEVVHRDRAWCLRSPSSWSKGVPSTTRTTPSQRLSPHCVWARRRAASSRSARRADRRRALRRPRPGHPAERSVRG